MKLHINWLNLFRATPLLVKEGLGVVDYAATTRHAQPSSTTPNPSFPRRGTGYRASPDNMFQGGGLVTVQALTTCETWIK